MNPVLLVIAGPNGAGKTTITDRLRADNWSEGVEYLNPDNIAQERFGDWNSQEAVLAAAKWTTARREELLAQRAGIAFETVMSAADKVEFVARAKELGYFVRVFFVSTSHVLNRFRSRPTSGMRSSTSGAANGALAPYSRCRGRRSSTVVCAR